MGAANRQFRREFKVEAVRQVLEEGRPLAQVARKLEISGSVLRRWRQQVEATPLDAFPGHGRRPPAEHERRTAAYLRVQKRGKFKVSFFSSCNRQSGAG